MTPSGAETDTDTDVESDNGWAYETLGTSATISGGSDCFTVDVQDDAGYDSTQSGTEYYSDGYDQSGTGTAGVDSFGSFSTSEHQEFGDDLGIGGAITSGNLSYTDTVSDTSGDTSTGTYADDFEIPTTILDNSTAYESGNETLGAGGTIEGGTASFSWSDGSSTSLEVTSAGSFTIDFDGVNTYGFSQSGSQSITTGGADVPGSASFDWTQEATANDLDYNSTFYSSNTESASWHDDGTDQLNDNDALTGVTDHFTWIEYDSMTGSINHGLATFSAIDAGCDTLSADESESGCLTLISGTASHTVSEILFDYGSSFALPFFPDTNILPFGGPDNLTAFLGVGLDPGNAGVAQTDPTVILTAVAAAGRDPTDITIPTQGSEGTGTGSSSGSGGSGSGGDGDAIRSGGSGASGASGSGVMVSQGALSLPGGSASGTGASGSSSTTDSSASVTVGAEAASGSPPSSNSATSSGAATASVSSVTDVGTTSAPADATAGAMVEAEDDPPPAQGSNLSPAGAFFYSLYVQGGQALQNAGTAIKDTGEGLYAMATSSEARAAAAETWDQTRVQPLANRLVQIAELRGTTEEITNANSPKLALYVIEDMVGAPAVEASVGYGLTGKQMEGELLDGGERTQNLLVGIAGGASFGASALSTAAAASGLTFRLGAAPKTAQFVNCFSADTLIATEHGQKAIQNIRASERVWAFDLVANEWKLRHVIETYQHEHDGDMAAVSVAGEEIESTGHHPWWVVRGEALGQRPQPEHVPGNPVGFHGEGRWVDAIDLRVGDVLLLRSGEQAPISRLSVRHARQLVYNFHVEELECYAVGNQEVLVHNNSFLEGKTPLAGTRRTGVNRATAAEVDLVQRTGQGTIEGGWTAEEIAFIKETGQLPQNIVGHHINNVAQFPEWAGDPRNIRFVRGQASNLAEHGGNFQNPTTGPLIDR
jgi:hypothetical protein